MARDPASWPDSPRLDPMPMGGGRIAAPPPVRPPGVHGPWPQASVIDRNFYAPVLDVPAQDRLDHVGFIVSRYLRQIVRETPRASAQALWGRRLVAVDDDEFSRILTGTSFGQLVLPLPEGAPPADFAAVIRTRAAAYATLDFTVAPTRELLPGMYAAPVMVLVRREGERWRVAAIRVDRRVVTPGEGDTWTLAKWYALQGAQLRLVCATHPRLHFPADVINAVTRSVVPPTHPLFQLVHAHTRFTLGLHEAVIHHRRSTIHNSQREVYNCFPYTTEGMHQLVAAGHRGVALNPAWPAWSFGEEFVGEHVPYGRYRRAWLDAWTGFAAEALADVPADDPAVRAWADHIAAWLPGFPDGCAVARNGALARAVGLYLCTVSTFHTADHHSYASISIEKMPWRIRTPFPAEGPVRALDPGALVTPEDSFRARLAHTMFFRPSVITSLRDVSYSFGTARGRAAARTWRATMDALDARWSGSGFARSDEIASGLHY